MELSIIVPVYNGEAFIKQNVLQLREMLSSHMPDAFELVLVNDGSSDATATLLKELEGPCIRIVSLHENSGKYAAIAAGMSVARGFCRIFTDADLPYDLSAIFYIVRLINKEGYHLAIGDRTLVDSSYSEHLLPLRKFATRAFSMMVRLFVTGGLFDTQCGIKGFRSDVAEVIFPLLREKGFAGDVELLYIALKYNLSIRRIPVRLQRSSQSTVRVIRHGISMTNRILHLRSSWKRGDYYSERLAKIACQKYWE